MRPTCQSWITILPPASWTASVTFFHPAICAALWMPGVQAYPLPSGVIWLASVMIRPAPARWR